MEFVVEEPREMFLALLLDTKHRLNAVHRVSLGTLDSCSVEPRDVFQAALLANAATTIVAHNRPSGDPAPSPEDVAGTRRMIAADKLLGVPLLDSLVAGERRYESIRLLYQDLDWSS